MGFYINPPDEHKEDFLNREGIAAPSNMKLSWQSVPDGYLPVVLINNGMFTAAGIAYSEDELKAFTRPDDHRPKQIFFVKIEKLLQVSGGLADFLKHSS